jgi:hypothetical protein
MYFAGTDMRALTVFGCTIKGDRLLVPAMKETLEG